MVRLDFFGRRKEAGVVKQPSYVSNRCPVQYRWVPAYCYLEAVDAVAARSVHSQLQRATRCEGRVDYGAGGIRCAPNAKSDQRGGMSRLDDLDRGEIWKVWQ